MFLFTFSYWMLCGFIFEENSSDSFALNSTMPSELNESLANSTANVEETKLDSKWLKTSWIEWLIMIWVFAYLCQIFREVKTHTEKFICSISN